MAHAFGTTRERFNIYSGLTALAKALEGTCTTVDLRNDTYVTGVLDEVDGHMNITVKDAILTDTRGRQYHMDNFFVHNRNVRYVHIPEDKPMVDLMKMQLDKMRRRPKQKPIESFVTKKIMKEQMNMVASLKTRNTKNE